MVRHPQFYKFFVVFLTGLVFYFPFDIIHTLAISTTDQNYFFNPPSNVVFNQEIEGSHTEKIRTGDFLVRIGDKVITDLEDTKGPFSSEDMVVTIEVVDAVSDVRKQVEVHSEELRKSVQAIPPAARIISVQKDGASDRAGLQKGDLIISINDQAFPGIFEADEFMRRIKPGETAVYKVLRRMEPIECHVQLADFGIPFNMFFNWIGALLFLVPGLSMGLVWHRTKPSRRLAEAFILLGGFSLLLFLDFAGFDRATRSYVFFVRMVLGLAGITALIHARWYFPSERQYLTSKTWVLILPWIMAMAVVGTALFFYPQFGPFRLYYPISIGVLLAFPVILRFLFRKHKTIRDAKIGKQIRILDWMLMLSAMGMLFVDPLQFVTIGLFFAIPVLYVHTILKHGLFDIQFRLDKNIQYSIFLSISMLLVTVAGGFWIWFLAQLNLHLPRIYFTENTVEMVENGGSETTSLVFERIILILLTLLGYVVLRWAFKRIRFLLKKQFHRQGYDYKTAAQQLTEALFNRFNLKSLSKALAGKIAELMEVKHAGVLVFDGDELVMGERGLNLNLTEETSLSGLKLFLKTFHGTFSVDYLDGTIKKSFTRSGVQYITPIRSQNDPLGCLLIGPKRSDTCLDGEDFNFLKAASSQSAMAIENALLYHKLASQERMKHELEIARKVQLSSLPQRTPDLERFDLSADSIPALEVGGDYFDYLEVQEDKIHIIIGDVSGKGTSAAFYMSKIQGVFRALAFNHPGPMEMFLQANPIICRSMEKNSFVTALSLVLSSGSNTALFSRAGHVGLYHYSEKDSKTTIHQPSGMALGICDTPLFEEKLEEKSIEFGDGDIFVLISDGLSEAVNAKREDFGEYRITETITRLHGLSAGELKASILNEVQKFAGNSPQHDDQTLVVVKIRSGEAP